jgi:type III secretion system FlhB-like substrate exporter
MTDDEVIRKMTKAMYELNEVEKRCKIALSHSESTNPCPVCIYARGAVHIELDIIKLARENLVAASRLPDKDEKLIAAAEAIAIAAACDDKGAMIADFTRLSHETIESVATNQIGVVDSSPGTESYDPKKAN